MLDKAIANLKAESENARLNGLTMIDHLSPVATNAIPALKEFLAQPNREDLKVYAEKLLFGIDANYRREREDPSFQETQAERANAFAEKARAGQATVQELIAALRELPQAIPDVARALGAIGYEELSRRFHESPQAHQEMMSVTIMLTQIAGSDQPLASRLAAAEAFRQLQPTRERLLYTVEETAPAFATINNALNRLSGEKRLQVEAPFGNMLEFQRHLWTVVHKRSGDITDYPGSDLAAFARELGKVDRRTHDDFVAAMRKADPKFLQRP